jgi:predicted O-linked N-acetylglucosamine transferase (SPINDLY family)
VVTLRGRTFASRVAGSLLHAVGLDELVCDTVPQYESVVCELLTDAGRRQPLRAHTEAARGDSALFDGASLARQIEVLYDRMWERALAGLAPEQLPA